MALKKRGLGRGLDALLGDVVLAEPISFSRTLPVDRFEPNRFRPRKDIDLDRLWELADSIKAHGVVQPIVVQAGGNDRYELVAGERRWRAARLAGLAEIPAVVRKLDDRAASARISIRSNRPRLCIACWGNSI